MRRTCRWSTAGSRSVRCSAAARSSSSGMLLQRKNDSRDASSKSSDAIGGARRQRSAGSRSKRNTKPGSASSRRSPISMPRSKSPALAPLVVEGHQRRQVGVGRPDGATRAAPASTGCAARTGVSSARARWPADEDPRAARRVSGPGDVVRAEDLHARQVRHRRVSELHAGLEIAVVESNRWNRSSTYAADFLTNVTAIVCGPALTGRRISTLAAPPRPPRRAPVAPAPPSPPRPARALRRAPSRRARLRRRPRSGARCRLRRPVRLRRRECSSRSSTADRGAARARR